ncbi:retinol dehydrogenase 13-like [Amphiura filiformis]|uniref:retinol dehydrogenase 13-like n=1 Tax=Amphiura filiformis TaxID=82378 RepID=UPI003B20CA91
MARGPGEWADMANRFFTTKIAFRVTVVGAMAGLTVLLKDWAGGPQCKSKVRMEGKTVIITGSNTGIGKETAMDLAHRGAKVILACRDEKKALKARKEIITESGNPRVVFRKLDLASLKSIRDFASEIDIEEENVHVLVNNAGIMRCPEWKTEDGFEMQFGVNHLGHFYLTNLLLDKIKASAPSRIITLSSLAHHRGEINFDDLNSKENYNKSQAYSNSKLSNVLFTHELSKRLKGTGVTANSVHPGIVRTELSRHMGISKSYFSSFFWGPINYIVLKSPKQGAQTVIDCAVNDKLEDVSGKYFKDCAKVECNAKGKDDDVAKKLWQVSAEIVGLAEKQDEEENKMIYNNH